MKTIIFIILAGLTGASCVQEIHYDINESDERRLVVEGGLTTENTIHRIRLSLSGGVSGSHTLLPASGAEVIVTNGQHEFRFHESGDMPGDYYSDSVAATVGVTYTLNINYNEKLYEAEASAVKAKAFHPISYYPVQEDGPVFGGQSKGFYSINLPGNFGGGDAFIYTLIYDIGEDWKDNFPYPIPPAFIDRNYYGPRDTTYLTHPGMETAALFEYGQTTFVGLPLGTKLYEKRYYLSDGYYNFLRSVLMETEWRGVNIMQAIPANVPTNITNEGLGYFYVMDYHVVESEIKE